MLSVITNEDERAEMAVSLDEICRQGAQQMLAAALEAEVADYVDAMSGEVDENGHRLVRRNGRHEPRTITTAAGKVEIHQPRVDDRRTDPTTGEKLRFASSLIPPWARKSPKVSAVLPLLYLHGMSSGDFSPALTEFFGHDAGLSASSITRLTTDWQAEQREFMNRDLTDHDYVYVWVDGVHFNVRLEEARLCCLVIVGVTLDGTKELIAIVDGYRESTESWLDLLRDLDRRGMNAPTLAVGDGALGFWNALEQIWPTTVPQRDWVHKVANILDAMPKTAQRTAKKMLDEIRNAEDGELARAAAAKFDATYRAKFPKAADKLANDLDRLLAFYDYPADHWVHLKTSNPIESTFATVRQRTKVTKGPGSRAAGLAMAYKLIGTAEDGWRRINSPHLAALVRAGAKFEKGQHVTTNPEDQVAA